MKTEISPLGSQHQGNLRDESRLQGTADTISQPETLEDAEQQIRELSARGAKVTLQGGRTGICGGAVPMGGHILDLSRLNHITALRQDENGTFFLTVEAGTTLQEIKERLILCNFDTKNWDQKSMDALAALRKSRPHRFLPNPTEESATIGGAFSCNAKGLNALRHGSVADHVQELLVCLPDGRLWTIPRGKYLFDETGCPLPDGGRLETAMAREPLLFEALAPRPGLDLVDLFAGSEGMLGTVLRLTLRLAPQPELLGIMFFFHDWGDASSFAEKMTERAEEFQLSALEFFDAQSIKRVEQLKKMMSRLRQLPEVPEGAAAAIYAEMEDADESCLEERFLPLSELFAECGGEEADTWAGLGVQEIEKFYVFRHAVPEAVNCAIDEVRQTVPSITKVCVDFTYPSMETARALCRYEKDIACSGLEGVVFGHVGCGRLHVNLIPTSEEEHRQALQLVEVWAKAAWELGAVLCGENGVGKQKKKLLSLAPPERMVAAQGVKNYFDPDGRYNPQNLF